MAVVWLALLAAPSWAMDLAQIERSIVREPLYESKQPQYCLLAFGPDAKVRVWLALDGDVLYLDRNGNGDLTDPEDRIAPVKVYHHSEERPNIQTIRVFFLPFPQEGDADATAEPVLRCFPNATGLIVEQTISSNDEPNKARFEHYRRYPFRIDIASHAGWEQDAVVAFTEHPKDAPILHFLGPQQVIWAQRSPLKLSRGETVPLRVGLQTPGVGGRVRPIRFPGAVRTVAEIEFPASVWSWGPICRRVDLKEPGG